MWYTKLFANNLSFLLELYFFLFKNYALRYNNFVLDEMFVIFKILEISNKSYHTLKSPRLFLKINQSISKSISNRFWFLTRSIELLFSKARYEINSKQTMCFLERQWLFPILSGHNSFWSIHPKADIRKRW